MPVLGDQAAAPVPAARSQREAPFPVWLHQGRPLVSGVTGVKKAKKTGLFKPSGFEEKQTAPGISGMSITDVWDSLTTLWNLGEPDIFSGMDTTKSTKIHTVYLKTINFLNNRVY
jgi:hypothetical protein